MNFIKVYNEFVKYLVIKFPSEKSICILNETTSLKKNKKNKNVFDKFFKNIDCDKLKKNDYTMITKDKVKLFDGIIFKRIWENKEERKNIWNYLKKMYATNDIDIDLENEVKELLESKEVKDMNFGDVLNNVVNENPELKTQFNELMDNNELKNIIENKDLKMDLQNMFENDDVKDELKNLFDDDELKNNLKNMVEDKELKKQFENILKGGTDIKSLTKNMENLMQNNDVIKSSVDKLLNNKKLKDNIQKIFNNKELKQNIETMMNNKELKQNIETMMKNKK